jgi:hypothetical protein
MRGWEAHVESDWQGGGHRLWVYKPTENGVLIVGADRTLTAVSNDVAPDPSSAIYLPDDSWAAIQRLAAPHADAGEVKALRESLELERTRVNRVLGWES